MPGYSFWVSDDEILWSEFILLHARGPSNVNYVSENHLHHYTIIASVEGLVGDARLSIHG